MNNLIILSSKYKQYSSIIIQEKLPGLNLVLATDDPGKIRKDTACEIVFGDAPLIRQVLEILPGLQWVQTTWAGVEPLVDPLVRHDYQLTNARHVFGSLMSEYVFGYILQHHRRIIERYLSQKKGIWVEIGYESLQGKKIGLLGVGSIGSHLAFTASHFGLYVKGYTISSQTSTDVDEYFHESQLYKFASGLDFLVNTLPNTDATYHIINEEFLGKLPAHCLLLNIGRGSTIDEIALMKALNSGKLAGAVLDVFEKEPLPLDNPLWKTPNVLITSHTAAHSDPHFIADIFIENFGRYLRNQPLNNLVNFKKGY
jgi:phosphoglycerate dehydrogenase-like enzyme